MTTKASPNVIINSTVLFTNPTFTGTVIGVSAAAVGLGNVTNTSDVNKPVSTAQQTALDLKANIANPTFTGIPAAPTAAILTDSTQLATTAFVQANGLHSAGGIGINQASYTITSADYGRHLYVNYAGVCTITLPATTPPAGTIISISSLTSYDIIINTGNANNIYALGLEGVTSVKLIGSFSTLMLTTNTSSWIEVCSSNGIRQYAIFQDDKANNVDGGSSAAASTVTRTLNTTQYNTILGCSLSGNQVTIPIGLYSVYVIAPVCQTGFSSSKLRNITSSVDTLYGSGASSGTTSVGHHNSIIVGILNLSATTVFSVQQYTASARATYGLGASAGIGMETYTRIIIEKLI